MAVIPGLTDTCLKNSCTQASTGGDAGCSLKLAQTQLQRQTQVTSHELSEMITDPRVSLTAEIAWNDPTDLLPDGSVAGEIGDICNGQTGTITVASRTWTVQLIYSKWDDILSNGAITCVDHADNPLPSLLPAFYFDVNKNNFGPDEVADQPKWPNDFWLALEGYSIDRLGSIIPDEPFTGTFAQSSGGPAISHGSIFIKPETTDRFTPQRISFYYDLDFSSVQSGLFPQRGQLPVPATLRASISAPSNPMLASAEFELVSGADPYFVDVDTAQGNAFYLSQDLRVFTATPAQNSRPVPGAPPFSSDGSTGAYTSAGAYTYIQNLIGYLNQSWSDPFQFGNPTSSDPFNPANSVIPDQSGAFTDGNSSVAPQTNGDTNFVFAVARVRTQGRTGAVRRSQERESVLSIVDHVDGRHQLRSRDVPKQSGRHRPADISGARTGPDTSVFRRAGPQRLQCEPGNQ